MSAIIERITNLPTAELTTLLVESEQEGWRFLRRLLDEWSSGKNRFDRPSEVLLGARDADRLVGVCGLNVDPYIDSPRVGRVRRLYVSVGYRRQGIGRQLVQQIMLLSRGTFEQLRLRTNNPDAARFYETLGFHPRLGIAECSHTLVLPDDDR